MPPIVGYIHVCQKGEWKRSFDRLIACIKKSGLYAETSKIRLGVLTADGQDVDRSTLGDPLFEIVYVGRAEEYERPTLLHMRRSSDVDPPGTLYYY